MGVDFVEAESPAGPFGAKGLGEVPLMAVQQTADGGYVLFGFTGWGVWLIKHYPEE